MLEILLDILTLTLSVGFILVTVVFLVYYEDRHKYPTYVRRSAKRLVLLVWIGMILWGIVYSILKYAY